MNWIQKANERMRNSILSKKEAGITVKKLKRYGVKESVVKNFQRNR